MLHTLYKVIKCIKTLHIFSLCKLNMYLLLLKLQKWFSQEQWEIISLLLFD